MKKLALVLMLTAAAVSCSSGSNHDRVPVTADSVLMCGRSVMGGWFSYWGSDGSRPVTVCGRSLYYGELESPDGIIDSFESRLNEFEGVKVAFFKLCFVDFDGGSRADAEANLARNRDYIRRAYDLCASRGVSVIFGNALPSVAGYATADLVWNHRAYNSFLDGFASSHPGCVVFDLYGILSNRSGALRPEYASAPDDSHLNEAGYQALSARFCEFF